MLTRSVTLDRLLLEGIDRQTEKKLHSSFSLCLRSLFLPSKGASGGSDEVAAVAALATRILDRRPKEEGASEAEEEQLCCFGDRTRASTDDVLALAARPGRAAARLLLRLKLRASEAQGCACAGENVARDAIPLKRERKKTRRSRVDRRKSGGEKKKTSTLPPTFKFWFFFLTSLFL